MTRNIQTSLLILILIVTQSSCVMRSLGRGRLPTPAVAAPRQGYGTLANFPFKEGWYGIYLLDEKIGFSHFKIQPAGRDFEIENRSMLRVTAMKATNEISSHDKVRVRPDLALISLESQVKMNRKQMRAVGRVEGDQLKLNLEAEGEKMNLQLPIQGEVYHSTHIPLMTALKGLKEGASYSFAVFNPQKLRLEKVDQVLLKVTSESGPNGAAWRVRSSYGRAVVNSWLDAQGLTVLEKAQDGSMISILEDEAVARKFLNDKEKGKDLALGLSLIKVSRPIPAPQKVTFLRIRMEGVDSSAIPSDHRQRVAPSGDDSTGKKFELAVRREDLASLEGKKEPLRISAEYLASDVTIQSDHKEIVAQAEKIVSPEDTDLTKVRKLVDWTAKNIKREMKDSFTALSVLRDGEGECESHAKLYTALARSRKIPTRMVMGLVYAEKAGFLYHAWAESYVNGWMAVDPTSGQVPADATHIKIGTGDYFDGLDSMMKLLGKVKIEVLDFK